MYAVLTAKYVWLMDSLKLCTTYIVGNLYFVNAVLDRVYIQFRLGCTVYGLSMH